MIERLLDAISKIWTPASKLKSLSKDLHQLQERQALASLYVGEMSRQAVRESHHSIRAAHAAMAIVAGRR